MGFIKRFLFFGIVFFMTTSFSKQEYDYLKLGLVDAICLDAGHGGKDPGALGSISKEKIVTLAVIKKINELIKANNPNLKIKLTRDTDDFIELNERAGIANRMKADLFVSVHCNSNENKSASGSSTYVMGLHKEDDNLDLIMKENSSILLEDNHEKNYDGFDPKSVDSYIIFSMLQNAHLKQSLKLASKIEQYFVEIAKRKSRGVHQAGFLVLWKTTMPSCLVEIGFISNKEEEKFMTSTEGQNFFAKSIYKAIKDYSGTTK